MNKFSRLISLEICKKMYQECGRLWNQALAMERETKVPHGLGPSYDEYQKRFAVGLVKVEMLGLDGEELTGRW